MISTGKALSKALRGLPENEVYRKYIWQRIGLDSGYLRASEIHNDEARSPTDKQLSAAVIRDELTTKMFFFLLSAGHSIHISRNESA